LYTLSENGSIQVFDLGNDGNEMRKVASLSHAQIQDRASNECRTVDRAFFTDIVSINAIPSTRSQYLHLVATTRKGVRLYFTCLPPTPISALISTPYGVSPPSLPETADIRPTDLRLRHVRIPPGYNAGGIGNPYFTVYDTLFSHEVSVMVAECGVDAASTVTCFSSSNLSAQDYLMENLTKFSFTTTVLAVERTLSNAVSGIFLPVEGSVDVRPPYIISQHRDPPERIVILNEKGISIVEQRSPVDILREILHQFGADSPQANYFLQLHGAINTCVMALIILCADNAADLAIKDAALRIFSSLGSQRKMPMNGISAMGMRSPAGRLSSPDWPQA
uniref:Nuclear pore complex protein Nup155 (inferred by orthology to a human protein) n=1 Tax=Anisakis simplex TaxID=6269 RepID=A0A0M3KFF3_ANISI